MDDRTTLRSGYPLTIPDALLTSDAMRQACMARDFQEIFRLVNRRTGSSHSVMAAAVGKMTSSRVSDIIRGVRSIRGHEVVTRVADGFGIPGEMLGLPPRPWEGAEGPANPKTDSVQKRIENAGRDGATAFPSNEAMQIDRGHRAMQALEVIGDESSSMVSIALGDLISHYTLRIYSVSPAEVYDEILAVRGYASRFLGAGTSSGTRQELTLSIGWLSCLLGIAACDMGAHAAAHLWCSDAQRRSEEVGHPELSGWAILTKSLVSFYQGRPHESVNLTVQGQSVTRSGTVVHARLATQEMRASAMAGDAGRTELARKYASGEIAKLPDGSKATGAFSISPGEDPPYTATSLMLLGRHEEAVSATNRVLDSLYNSEARQRGEHPSSYARALLILGLAHAGSGNLDEAVSAGHAALAGSRPAWPTIALAEKLDDAFKRNFAKAREVEEYRIRYQEISSQMSRGSSVSF
ncbi:hypothetical protein AB0D49_17650 [Streptomyces sp. NPDC048290]|uniref:hypothetical protein n=1 Tax=Streptomyces sp. NPDC048290 TaxID=3155811 RepID=UPI00343EAE05